MIPNIKLNKTFDLSVYQNQDFIPYLNLYNKFTSDNIILIKELIENGYFIVPSNIYHFAWGFEKTFMPFSDKLFKIISNNKGDTSLQIHPIKNEKWISLNNNSVVYDQTKEFLLRKYKQVIIPKNTVHALKKNAHILEIQDNNIFDSKETLRIYDKLGRETSLPNDYYKYFMPYLVSEFIFKDPTFNNDQNGDRILFLFDGYVQIEYNGQIIKLDKTEELYFLKENVKIINIIGNSIISLCSYYKSAENER